MKKVLLLALCAVLCAGCAKKMTTLSDGQPGYAIYCENNQERCFEDIRRTCGTGRDYATVSERAREVNLPLGWIDVGAPRPDFNSQYWMEIRCK